MSWIRKICSRRKTSSEKIDSAQRRGAASITADNPVRAKEDDALGRVTAATNFAEQVLSLDISEGSVVGVLGPWGSGKTSFINLARQRLISGSLAVLDFNPWMFSGTEQLVESFFVELSAQLRLRPDLADVGRDIEAYGEAFSGLGWLPLVGPWVERGRAGSKVLSEILKRRKEGIGGRRTRVEQALEALHEPLVVIVDDIDRLTTSEIRDIFKLVRLTANFPNVVYVLAFDRVRVEQALAEQGIPGRDYLEKIIQVGIDMPAVPAEVLNRQIFQAIDEALREVDDLGRFDETLWPDIFMDVVRPLIGNMRDVRRYATAVHGTARELAGSVALVDMLALEAVRVFLPDVFRELPRAVDGLTTTSDAGYWGGEHPHLKQEVDDLLGVAGDRVEPVRAMIERLFPAAQRHLNGTHYGGQWKNRWILERRVAHEDVLRFYLERTMSHGLQAFQEAEQAWLRMSDRNALDTFLRSLSRERLEDVVSRLEVYEEQFSERQVVPASVVLLNLVPDLPERERGMFEFGASLVIGRVVYRLIRVLNDPEATEATVRTILPELTTLSAKAQLITMVGYREGAGHKLVSEAAADELEREWRQQVRAAGEESLLAEWDLLRVLLMARREVAPDEPTLEIPASRQMTLALLRSARSDVRSQAMGSRAVRRSPRLSWGVLEELCGGDEALKRRLEGLRAVISEDDAELIELAERYVDGWRPNEFSDD
jgi:predicted KAP-like P-loop ATPase